MKTYGNQIDLQAMGHGADALKVPDPKQSKTNETVTRQKEGHMSTDTNTTTKAHTIALCGNCRAEYKAEKWHTENLCPKCYREAHPKAQSTTAQTVAKIAAGIALAVLVTKGTHYAVQVIDPETGRYFSKCYILKTHAEAMTLAEKMYHDRQLSDILDATPEAEATEAQVEAEAEAAGE